MQKAAFYLNIFYLLSHFLIFRRYNASMLLEIPGEERLVVEAEPEDYLLHGAVCGEQQCLYLQHAAFVDDDLRCVTRQPSIEFDEN